MRRGFVIGMVVFFTLACGSGATNEEPLVEIEVQLDEDVAEIAAVLEAEQAHPSCCVTAATGDTTWSLTTSEDACVGEFDSWISDISCTPTCCGRPVSGSDTPSYATEATGNCGRAGGSVVEEALCAPKTTPPKAGLLNPVAKPTPALKGNTRPIPKGRKVLKGIQRGGKPGSR